MLHLNRFARNRLSAKKEESPKPPLEKAASGDLDRQESIQLDPDDRPRIEAYSDSDSDVESHIQRVQTHLRPGSQQNAAEAALEAVTEEVLAEIPIIVQQKQPVDDQMTHVVVGSAGLAVRAVASALGKLLTPAAAIRACIILALGKSVPKSAHAVDMAALTIPLAEFIASSVLTLDYKVPNVLQILGYEIAMMGHGAIIVAGMRCIQRAHRVHFGRSRRRVRKRHSPGLHRASSVNFEVLEAAAAFRTPPPKAPETSSEWAREFSVEIKEMRRILEECEVQLPSPRFDDDAELLRYAKSCGLLNANTIPERVSAVELAVRKVAESVNWLHGFHPLPERTVKRYARLVSWKGSDAAGRPIFLVRAGRALQLMKQEKWNEFVQVVMTLVDQSIATRMLASSSHPQGEESENFELVRRTSIDSSASMAQNAEKMVVVVDCRGATQWATARHLPVVKKLAVELNMNYPERLHRLYLLELPMLGRWVVQQILPALAPGTRDKIVYKSAEDTDLPITVANLARGRSKGKLTRTLSDGSFNASSDADAPLELPDNNTLLDDDPAGTLNTPEFTLNKEDEGGHQDPTSPTRMKNIFSHDLPLTPSLLSPTVSEETLPKVTESEAVPLTRDALAKVNEEDSYMDTPKERELFVEGPRVHRIASLASSLASSACSSPVLVTTLSDLAAEESAHAVPLLRGFTRKQATTPGKSSLRRTVSDDGSSGGSLESHALGRQNSVSWAAELESVKEIIPASQEYSPGG